MYNYSYNVVWSDEDNCWIATSPEFPRLSAFGESPGEAFNEFEIALKAAIETYKEEGWELPQPKKVQDYSGQFRVRVPKKLHAQLAHQAESEGVSLNTLVVSYLAGGLVEKKSLPQSKHEVLVIRIHSDRAQISGDPSFALGSTVDTYGYAIPQAKFSARKEVYPKNKNTLLMNWQVGF